MARTPENPELLARECLEAGLRSAVLSSPRHPTTEGESTYDKIRVRPVSLKAGDRFQIEQLKGQKAFHRNVEGEELCTLLAGWLATTYNRAEVVTATGTIQIMANRRGQLSALRKTAKTTAQPIPGGDGHNRAKQYILEEGRPVPFLIDLGVMTADGTVIKARYDKFRQINRFLEFIADVLDDLKDASSNPIPRPISIIDFGCGKSYLTFAVYHYLSTLQGLSVNVVGLDLKEDVIADCSLLAKKYGYEGLRFQIGDIADYSGTDPADLVISLHACDTATDFALAKAVQWKAKVILAVPCCQHELNAQLGKNAPEILVPLFRHGIVRERMAALITDAFRASLLEAEGYRVQILEFIDMSHTPKNLLIRAVRKNPEIKRTEEPVGEDYHRLRDFLSVEPTLEGLLEKKRAP